MTIELIVTFTCPSCGNSVRATGNDTISKDQECPGGCGCVFALTAGVQVHNPVPEVELPSDEEIRAAAEARTAERKQAEADREAVVQREELVGSTSDGLPVSGMVAATTDPTAPFE